jgi:hypothetical protein
MKLFNIGSNDYYHVASIHLDEVPFGLYYLREFLMWVCGHIPNIPFPKCIPWKSPEGWMSMREWFGDTQQWFHVNICTPMFYFTDKHTKHRHISLPYSFLKKEFPDFFENESEWDEEDKQFRQLTKEMAWDVENDFKHMQYKMDFKYIKAKCDVQVEWYNKVVNGEIKLKPPYEKTAYQLDLEAYQNY